MTKILIFNVQMIQFNFKQQRYFMDLYLKIDKVRLFFSSNLNAKIFIKWSLKQKNFNILIQTSDLMFWTEFEKRSKSRNRKKKN